MLVKGKFDPFTLYENVRFKFSFHVNNNNKTALYNLKYKCDAY